VIVGCVRAECFDEILNNFPPDAPYSYLVIVGCVRAECFDEILNNFPPDAPYSYLVTRFLLVTRIFLGTS
ncbi:hypothetical protein, partial [Microcoleus sp. Aus8_D3]|uniref:hypothetical protein n=1 Tax=Microcoleus sp. Aus8_D3 TaxID=2818633 RepID=UPI002FD28EED